MQIPSIEISWLEVAIFVALGFLVSWGVISLILRLKQVGAAVAGRSGKDFHHAPQAPIPRLGGVGLIISFLVVCAAIALTQSLSHLESRELGVIALSCLAMFALGLWDDLRHLRAHWKLLLQIAIASAVYFGDIRIEIFKNPVTETAYGLGICGFFATVLWLVTLTNLINLIDGIDGLAGGISLMLMVLLANLGGVNTDLVMLLAVGVAGALLGFLKFNYPPAKIYMGDGGAYFIGFLIGILSIINSYKGSVIAALIAPTFALALPFVDASLAVMRRGIAGLPLFRPDRKHIHHRLIALGFSRDRAVLSLYTVSLVCLLLAFSVFYWQGRLLPLFVGLLFLVFIGAGHFSGYTKNWFTIGSRVGKSLALRKETRYALVLCRWLQIEAEKQKTLDGLWQDYQFLVNKFGFSRVRLILPDGAHIWQSEGFQEKGADMHLSNHEMNGGMIIEFAADKTKMPEILFDLLSDLAAETWYKASSHWMDLNKAPMKFTVADFKAGSSGQVKPIYYYGAAKQEPLKYSFGSSKE